MTEEILSYEQAQDLLHRAIVAECTRRTRLRLAITPLPSDPVEVTTQKTKLLFDHLIGWARDPILFVKDNAWIPDPQKNFGSDVVPEGLSPKGMLPYLPTKHQTEMIETWHATLNAPDKCDCSLDKTRHAAATSLFLWAVALHGWLFGKSTTGLLGSYEDSVIDKGGKGQRDPTSLFGRLRMFLDAFMWNFSWPSGRNRISHLAFSRPKPQGRRKAQPTDENLAGMSDSDDINYKLTRPRWFIEGLGVLFPGGEGNWLQGARPGENFGRSYSATWALLDEVDHYAKIIGKEADRAAWRATNQNVRCRFLIGTPIAGGSGNSLLRDKSHAEPSDVLKIMHFDWCDLPFYMIGAWWECKECGHPNPLKPTETPRDGTMLRDCGACRSTNALTKYDLESPWKRRAFARMSGDLIGIAAEIMRDWAGAVGDRLFANWHAGTGVRQFVMPSRPVVVEGFDPGMSAENPASWLCAVVDPQTLSLQIVGYWMASEAFVEWWVPFFKRWDRKRMARQRPMYSKYADRTWTEAFPYDEEALAMMDRVAQFPLGAIGGDKSGTHRWMVESPYERLADYGIGVFEEYTKDREALVRAGVEWSARMTIDPAIKDVRPKSPLGVVYPSVVDVFAGAKPKPHTGQAEYRFDVDKQEPKHVVQACDAWFYLVRALQRMIGGDVHAKVSADGSWAVEPYGGKASEPWSYAGQPGGIGL